MAFVSVVLLVLAILVAAIATFLLIPTGMEKVSTGLHRVEARARLVDENAPSLDLRDLPAALDMVLQDLAHRGVPRLAGMSDWLLGFPKLEQWFEGIAQSLEIGKGLSFQARTLCQTVMLGSLLLLALSCLLSWGFLAGLLLVVLALLGLHMFAERTRQHLEDDLMAQLPDALDSLGICFSAGLSISQAFQAVAEETEEPLVAELERVVFDLQGGRSIQEALDSLEARSSLAELRFIAIALEIQSRTGGSFRPILEGASRSILNTLELKRLLGVQTAQARLSARVVTVMPIVLLAILSLAKKSYLSTFFTSGAGIAIFSLALALEAVGIFSIRRILAVEVS